ncbi:MAG: hypothetical protein EOO24_62630, partial [Comamonadaceae bacterium]
MKARPARYWSAIAKRSATPPAGCWCGPTSSWPGPATTPPSRPLRRTTRSRWPRAARPDPIHRSRRHIMTKQTSFPTRRTALRLAASLAGAGLLAASFGPVLAQTKYPSAPVKLIVPFGPATGPDILGRTIGQKLADQWGQPVVVENKNGASSAIGTQFVAAAQPDGQTLMVTANTLVLNKALRPAANYDPVKDLQPITPLAIGRLALVAHPTLGVKNVAQLLAMAKAKPGDVNYASPGNGTPHHLAMELFQQGTGVSLTHIPYSSTPAAVKDVLGGQVKLMFLPIHVAQAQVKAGKLVMLASGGKERAEATPDVPSVAEASGVKDFDADIWY